MRIFISAVSSEFRECRTALASDLRAMGAEVLVQEDFQQRGATLLEKLESYIAGCDRVIVLLGEVYGFEAPTSSRAPTTGNRRSYTQWEYYFAIGERLDGQHSAPKSTYIYVANDSFRTVNQLQQSLEHKRRQRTFVDRVLGSGRDHSMFGSLDELCRLVIRDGFDLRRTLTSRSDNERINGYLRFLSERLDRIDVASPDLAISTSSGGLGGAGIIETVCTTARASRIMQLTDTRNALDISSTERDVFAAIADGGRRVVLLGAPGSGKTTIARWLAIRQAEMYLAGRSHTIPIYLPMRRVDISQLASADDLIDAALDDLAMFTDTAGVEGYFKLNHPRLAVIVDGLDELPTRSRSGEDRATSLLRLYTYIESVLAADEGSRVLLTSRLQDYLHNRSFRYPKSENLLISDLGIEQMDETIENWHRAARTMSVFPADRQRDWEARAKQIQRLIHSDVDLAAFAANPLCLNLLQLVYEESGKGHLSVSRICDLAIMTLLFARTDSALFAAAIESKITEFEYRALLLSVLSDVAVDAVESVASGGDGMVSFARVQSIVAGRVGATSTVGFLKHGSLLHPIMTEIVREQGILINVNEQYFMFAHTLFRDTLAGRALMKMTYSECRDRARKFQWSQVFRHVAGLSLVARGSTLEAIALAHYLFESSRSELGETTVLAAAEIVAEIYAAGRSVDLTIFDEFADRMREYLKVAVTTRKVPTNRRIELGLLLGRMGDPRFETTPVQPSGLAYVALPSVRLDLGAKDTSDIGNPKYRLVFPHLIPNVEFDEFSVARYLVTNDQYGEFIEDGGYSTDAYWVEEGLRWLREDLTIIAELRELMRTTSLTHFYTDLQNGRVTELEIEDALSAMLFRRLPLFWFDRSLNNPNQPVVGVNWWEAKAYSKWIGLRRRLHGPGGGLMVDLPTEYEWERAARIGLRHRSDTIWTDGMAEDHAHWNALHRLSPAPAPVGIYPWGSPQPDGPHDLVGNVWEWTTSARHDYGPGYVHEPFIGAGLADRMVRGGSWLSSEPLSATISFRSFDPPCNAYDDLGFRLAIVPRPSC